MPYYKIGGVIALIMMVAVVAATNDNATTQRRFTPPAFDKQVCTKPSVALLF
jgi:hypothetical protein